MEKRQVVVLALAALFAFSVYYYDMTYIQKDGIVVIKTQDRDIQVQVEFAETSGEWKLGLMYREELGKNEGMFFIFNNEKILNFWMMNMSIPLDIIFISEEGIVTDIYDNVPPCAEEPCERYASSMPVRYVLEVNAGFSEDNNIKQGESILWRVIRKH